MDNLVERLRQGDRRALARLLTQIENATPEARHYLAKLHAETGKAHVIGITGSPGVGKSTLLRHLVQEIRQGQHRVGILAIDPSSPFTGGALLGDRIRMMDLTGDPEIFIRSMANRGNLGGLSTTTNDAIRAMDAAGYDPILIETVGTGQAEVEIMRVAQTVLVAIAPGMGDDIQALKAGIIEIADIFVVSKADKIGADQTVAELTIMLKNAPIQHTNSWHVPIVKTSAPNRQGFAELYKAIQDHHIYLQTDDTWTQRLRLQARQELEQLVLQKVKQALYQQMNTEEWQALTDDVITHKKDPYAVSDDLYHRLVESTGIQENQKKAPLPDQYTI